LLVRQFFLLFFIINSVRSFLLSHEEQRRIVACGSFDRLMVASTALTIASFQQINTPAHQAKTRWHGNRAGYFEISHQDASLARFSNAADKTGLKTTGITKGPFGVGCLLKMSSGNHYYEVLVDGAMARGCCWAGWRRAANGSGCVPERTQRLSGMRFCRPSGICQGSAGNDKAESLHSGVQGRRSVIKVGCFVAALRGRQKGQSASTPTNFPFLDDTFKIGLSGRRGPRTQR
jgi:hypothetical protein